MKNYAVRALKGFFTSIQVLFLAFFLSIFLTACLDDGSGSEDATQVVADPEEVEPSPLTPPERTVCDPFQSGASAQDRGLVGNLLYLTNEQPRYSRVADYIENGQPIQSTLYFDRLHVPTRAFDLGFYTQTGDLVLNQNGEAIYEYFALRLETQLTLAENEEPGWYQMAVLSDDGAVVEEKDSSGNLQTLIDNDGFTATRMGCAVKSIYLDRNSKKNVVVSWFQGPRYHIALNVLWRPIPSDQNPADPVDDLDCDFGGNAYFFDSTKVPSEPTQNYYELLERGWKPLTNENYYFPEQATNPCATEDPLLLTNFSINSTTRDSVSVSWNTSIGSSSQIEVKDVVSGVVVQSSRSSALVTNHIVALSGLSPNTLYSVKALSESNDGQQVESVEAAFRTAR